MDIQSSLVDECGPAKGAGERARGPTHFMYQKKGVDRNGFEVVWVRVYLLNPYSLSLWGAESKHSVV
jgi:hypothetical protein